MRWDDDPVAGDLARVVRDARRRFAYRSGVRELLGRPALPGVEIVAPLPIPTFPLPALFAPASEPPPILTSAPASRSAAPAPPRPAPPSRPAPVREPGTRAVGPSVAAGGGDAGMSVPRDPTSPSADDSASYRPGSPADTEAGPGSALPVWSAVTPPAATPPAVTPPAVARPAPHLACDDDTDPDTAHTDVTRKPGSPERVRAVAAPGLVAWLAGSDDGPGVMPAHPAAEPTGRAGAPDTVVPAQPTVPDTGVATWTVPHDAAPAPDAAAGTRDLRETHGTRGVADAGAPAPPTAPTAPTDADALRGDRARADVRPADVPRIDAPRSGSPRPDAVRVAAPEPPAPAVTSPQPPAPASTAPTAAPRPAASRDDTTSRNTTMPRTGTTTVPHPSRHDPSNGSARQAPTDTPGDGWRASASERTETLHPVPGAPVPRTAVRVIGVSRPLTAAPWARRHLGRSRLRGLR